MVVLTNFVPPTEGIKLQLPSTSVMINNREIGSGIIFITESTLSWVNDDSGEGFALEYPHISLHAVSRDRSSCPHENLYVMLDIPWDDPENEVQEVNSDDEDEDSVDMTELRFIPNDKGMLDAMFHAICECQALHPDPQDSFSEDDEEGIFEDEDEEGEYELGGSDQIARAATDPVESTNGDLSSSEPMEMDAGQFEDADCDPEN
ncbi:methylosome subunit pICln isoform X1 [Hetaerina americana]|uniref:methylosome subunit pICln isoform X1 n=1 Tax=Hetaerina americana TaxID=62018 RepID=UPI003A7F3063